ncbi:protein KTI12 homolog [Planococcus citri]|uniref:protein KTI12 homolog n=1 Tax=Planococcus citri TaxID=170843 RepID=UPI0031F7E7E5
MPLIVLTGYPSSGKTTRCKQIEKYFQDLNKKVHVVAESDVLLQQNIDKNPLSFDSKKQKEVRGILKSNVIRLLGSDIVILDASNNIKGFRYELYCASKCHKTTQCTIECDISQENAWELNDSRISDKYTREAFDLLCGMYEAPIYNNRWDSPLITIQLSDELPGEQIKDALFNRQAPPPNQSTQNVPLCSSTYLSDLDKVTKDVINAILSLQSFGVHGDNIQLTDFNVELPKLDDKIDSRKLAHLKRQFISYNKLNPIADTPENVAKSFVQFINSSIYDIK